MSSNLSLLLNDDINIRINITLSDFLLNDKTHNRY